MRVAIIHNKHIKDICMKSKIYTLLLLLPLLALVGCNEDKPQEKKVESLSITPDAKEMTVGETLELKVTQQPNLNKKVSFRSLNAELATVSDKGVVTAVAKGETTILAEVDGVSATCKVTIKEEQQQVPKEDFIVETQEITPTNIFVSIRAKDPNMLYAVNAGIEESYKRIIENRESQPNANREWWKTLSGGDLGSDAYRQAVKNDSYQGTEEFDLGSISGSDYPYPANHTIVLRVYGMDQDGKELTKVYEYKLQTKPRTPNVDLTFKVEGITAGAMPTTVKIIPSDQTKPYYFAVQSKKYVDFYKKAKEENKPIDGVPPIEMMCLKLVQTSLQQSPVPDVFKTGLHQFEMSDFTLQPKRDYVLIIFGWDKELGLTTDPAYFEFKTPANATN